MENIELGLLLMIVGMTTVFAILVIVIYLGKGLISVVNRLAPEEAIIKKQPQMQTQAASHSPAGMPANTTAAIVSAISMLTGGKGKVTKIEKQ